MVDIAAEYFMPEPMVAARRKLDRPHMFPARPEIDWHQMFPARPKIDWHQMFPARPERAEAPSPGQRPG